MSLVPDLLQVSCNQSRRSRTSSFTSSVSVKEGNPSSRETPPSTYTRDRQETRLGYRDGRGTPDEGREWILVTQLGGTWPMSVYETTVGPT